MAESPITKSPNEDALDMQLGAMQIDTNMHCSIEDTKNTVERKLIEVEDKVVYIPILDNIQLDTLITEAKVFFALCYKALN